MIATLAAFLNVVGIIAFAITGAMVASRKQMDIAGFVLLAVVTGIGGGTLRDLLIGVSPVGWVTDPTGMLLCVAVACVAFFTAHLVQSRVAVVVWCDALGLASRL